MTKIKIPYEILFRFGAAGEFAGAHQQFREVILEEDGVTVIAERILPASPFGSDPEFPSLDLLGATLTAALADAALKNTATIAAMEERDRLHADLETASTQLTETQTQLAQALAQIASLTEPVAPASPIRPEGKWWPNAAAFLAELDENELFAIHSSQVPLVIQLLMTLLAWTDEVWSSDQRILMGLNALVSLQILTPERRQQILS